MTTPFEILSSASRILVSFSRACQFSAAILALGGRWRAGAHPAAVKRLVRRPIPLKRRAVARCASITAATELIKAGKGELMNTQIHSDAHEHEIREANTNSQADADDQQTTSPIVPAKLP